MPRMRRPRTRGVRAQGGLRSWGQRSVARSPTLNETRPTAGWAASQAAGTPPNSRGTPPRLVGEAPVAPIPTMPPHSREQREGPRLKSSKVFSTEIFQKPSRISSWSLRGRSDHEEILEGFLRFRPKIPGFCGKPPRQAALRRKPAPPCTKPRRFAPRRPNTPCPHIPDRVRRLRPRTGHEVIIEGFSYFRRKIVR